MSLHSDWRTKTGTFFAHLVFFAYKSLNFCPPLYQAFLFKTGCLPFSPLVSSQKRSEEEEKVYRVFQICPFVDKNSIYFQSLQPSKTVENETHR